MEIIKIMRLRDVLEARGKGRSAHYNDIAKGLFTKPVKLSERAAGYPSNEVAAINAARIAGKSDAEIRALVEQLHEARKALA